MLGLNNVKDDLRGRDYSKGTRTTINSSVNSRRARASRDASRRLPRSRPPFLLRSSQARVDLRQPRSATDCPLFVHRLSSRRDRRSREASAAWLENDEGTRHAITEFGHEVDDRLIALGCAFAEFAQDQLDGNSGPPDDRLPEHDARIDLDAISECHQHQN